MKNGIKIQLILFWPKSATRRAAHKTCARGGAPVRHMNIQIWILSPDKINQINNLHIRLD
ncbi:MAG: hypothetical protein DRJ02_12995 [Bacteroidetes bacterium]|nr:MAG: hypothetical protein DRJ02_12995 [Bacteroidota bacterium]